MVQTINADICVIGGGSGGLSVAAGAAQMGAKTVLFEAGKMGGDCLNYGCVPSKALLAAGKAAAVMRHADRFGVLRVPEPIVDFHAVHHHVHGVIAGIAPHDSVERFEGLGVTVVQARARFAGPREVEGGDVRVKARRFVVATGSGPMIPPIPGLDAVPFLTNESVFDLTALPEHLIVVGGGAIGCELSQAFRTLGAQVTTLEFATILPKDDPEAAGVVRQALLSDGISLLEGAKVTSVAPSSSGGVEVSYEQSGSTHKVSGSHLLLAVGRKPTLEGLDLEKAGIEYTPKGIKVDARLRTTNKKVFAIGDVAGGLQFTHVAGYHAGIVVRNALFRMPSKADHSAIPWVTYTTPELAQVGLTEAQAKAQFGERVTVLRAEIGDNDRAQAERDRTGFVKAMVGKGGRILGATIVGAHAGDLLSPWILGVGKKLKIGDIANTVFPYPTLSEVNKRAAGSYYTPMLFSDRTRKIVRLLARLG